MREGDRCVALVGLGLSLVPSERVRGVRRRAEWLEVEVELQDGESARWVVLSLDGSGEGTRLERARKQLAGAVEVRAGEETDELWIETEQCRVPLPVDWALDVAECGMGGKWVVMQGAEDATISVRAPRRMPALESFQGPGQRFRDIGQLPRAGWMELEEALAAGVWLHRHEMLHRGMAPFVVTLRARLDLAEACMRALGQVVERLELPRPTR